MFRPVVGQVLALVSTAEHDTAAADQAAALDVGAIGPPRRAVRRRDRIAARAPDVEPDRHEQASEHDAINPEQRQVKTVRCIGVPAIEPHEICERRVDRMAADPAQRHAELWLVGEAFGDVLRRAPAADHAGD